jgi:UDP-3-O-[3-hydroxymyristoyl] glucosamine N-acyltransferase
MKWDIEYILSRLKLDFQLEGRIYNKNKKRIRGVASITRATDQDITFCSSGGEGAISSISKCDAGVILCKKSLEGLVSLRPEKEGQLFVFVENPRLAAIRIINLLYSNKKMVGISPTAAISKSARISKNCYIGDFTIIGDNCEIADNTIIDGRVSILQNCVIGKNSIVQPGAVIGADGFAYERHETFDLERFPHIGGVRIGNNVEISSNCSIARGSLSDTVIGDGTKLDALVHVAHNVEIGKDCALNSTVKHKLKMGNNVIVGSGASVIHDVPDEDIVAGVPAKSIKHKVTSKQLFLMGGHQDNNNRREGYQGALQVLGYALLIVLFLGT